MFLFFVGLPLAILLAVDVGAVAWWARRRSLMNGGVPATGEIVRVNITDYVDRDTRSVTRTTVRPVVRFTTQTGEVITTSPMRSGVDKLLIPGEPVKIRYSARNPVHCVVDQRGANRGAALIVVVLAVVNIFLIGFVSLAWQMPGDQPSIQPPAQPSIQPPALPSIQPPALPGIPQVPAQGTNQPTASGTGSNTTTPAAPTAAARAGAWSSDNGPLTVTIVKVVNAGGNVTLTVNAHDSARESVTLPIFGYFTATDDQGTTYTAHPLTPITVPANGTASGTLTLDQTVPASARSLSVKWSVFSADPATTGSITITGVPLPQ